MVSRDLWGGKLAAGIGYNDGKIAIWDPATWAKERDLEGLLAGFEPEPETRIILVDDDQ